MPAVAALADLAQPQLIRQPGSPLGELHRGLLSRRQADGSGEEFLPGPILAGMLVIGQTGNALLLHRGQKDRTVSFPVEHHGEAMKARIVLELLLAGLVRHILFKPRNQIAFHDLQQSRVDGLTDDKEGLTVHGVYPIVRRRAQTQSLPCDIVFG